MLDFSPELGFKPNVGIPSFDIELSQLLEHASTLMSFREFRPATNLLRIALQRSPYDASIIYQLGVCLRHCGRWHEAVVCFRNLAKDRPSIANIYAYADSLYRVEEDLLAQEQYLQLLPWLSSESEFLFETLKNLGNIAARARDFEAAEEYYNKAFTLNQRSDVLLVNFGTLEIQRERMEKALEHFRHAVDLNKFNDKAWVGLALVHRQMGDAPLAMANLRTGLDLNFSNKTAIKLLVEWCFADDCVAAALLHLQNYLAAEDLDAEVSSLLSKCLVYLCRFADAEIELQRALAIEPGLEAASNLLLALQRNRKPKVRNVNS